MSCFLLGRQEWKAGLGALARQRQGKGKGVDSVEWRGGEGRRDTYRVTPVRKYLFPTELSSRRWDDGRLEAELRRVDGEGGEC